VRILFFLQPGRNSRSIFGDMIRGFAQSGHETIVWELAPIWKMLETHSDRRDAMLHEVSSIVATLIHANGVDLSIGMWASALYSLANGRKDGQPATFFDVIDHPHLMFWLDAPQWAHGGDIAQFFNTPIVGGRRVHHLINSETTAREMRDVLGFTNVGSAPYGVDAQVFRPREVPQKFDVVFALGKGDPQPTALMLEQLDADVPDAEAIRHEQSERVRGTLIQLADEFEREDVSAVEGALCALLRTQLDSPREALLDRLGRVAQQDDALARGARALRLRPEAFVRAGQLVRRVDAWERAFTISYLSRHLHCATFGSGDLGPWAYRGETLGELPYEEQSLAYARGRLGLNVMRCQDDQGVNLKPMEIAASGRVCLMRDRPGIEDLFDPDREIVTFDGPGDALEKASRVLGDCALREQMARAAHDRVLADHTWSVRADELLERFGFSG